MWRRGRPAQVLLVLTTLACQNQSSFGCTFLGKLQIGGVQVSLAGYASSPTMPEQGWLHHYTMKHMPALIAETFVNLERSTMLTLFCHQPETLSRLKSKHPKDQGPDKAVPTFSC